MHRRLQVWGTEIRRWFSFAGLSLQLSLPREVRESGDVDDLHLPTHLHDLLDAKHYRDFDYWFDYSRTWIQQCRKKALVVGPYPCSVKPSGSGDVTRVEWVHPSEHRVSVAAEAVVETGIEAFRPSMPVPGFPGSSPLVTAVVEVSYPY